MSDPTRCKQCGKLADLGPFQCTKHPRQRADDLPPRIAVDDKGNYWCDYLDHYSMPPVSEGNEEVEVVAYYVRLEGKHYEAEAAPVRSGGLRTPLRRWLRGAQTRRMFARALGGGDKPDETYLRMATAMLSTIAREVTAKPWRDPTSGNPFEAEKAMTTDAQPPEALREALRRLLDAASVEEEDWSPATHDELVAALNQADAVLAGYVAPPDRSMFRAVADYFGDGLLVVEDGIITRPAEGD